MIDARLLVEAAADATRADILSDPHRALSAAQAERLDAYLARRERREADRPHPGPQGVLEDHAAGRSAGADPAPRHRAGGHGGAEGDPGGGGGQACWTSASAPARSCWPSWRSGRRPGALASTRRRRRWPWRARNAANLGLAGRRRCCAATGRRGWTRTPSTSWSATRPTSPPGRSPPWSRRCASTSRAWRWTGGIDGLAAYRALAPQIVRVLKPGGRFVVEIGHDQGRTVPPLFEAAGAADVKGAPGPRRARPRCRRIQETPWNHGGQSLDHTRLLPIRRRIGRASHVGARRT